MLKLFLYDLLIINVCISVGACILVFIHILRECGILDELNCLINYIVDFHYT